MIEPARPDATTRFFGGLLIAVGAVFFALCGLCTLGFAGFSIISAFTEPNALGAGFGLLLTALLLGGVPALGGFILMRVGWGMYRGPAHPPRDAGKVFDD